MKENGELKIIVEKAKPKRRDINYYPVWSLKVVPRTKAWERRTLVEPYKVIGKEILITPKFDELVSILEKILIHELRCDLAIRRKGDHPKFHKLFSQKVVAQKQQKLFGYTLPEIYRKCLK